MKNYNTTNGIYYGLTEKEIMWLVIHEKDLDQLEKTNKDLLYLSKEELDMLLYGETKDSMGER